MGKHIGYIGLGKMGKNMVERLRDKKWKITAYDVNPKTKVRGVKVTSSIGDLVNDLSSPRVIWVMVPAGKPIEAVLKELRKYLTKGDVVVDGGNSFYESSMKRAKLMEKKGINFLDVGVSGGPGGAKNGACLMIGGEKKDYSKLVPLFKDVAAPEAYGYMGKAGAGHFVKMVHNGIEYGMMQALAEGFEVLKKTPFQPDLKEVARVYNRRSVIESRLVGWLEDGFSQFGKDLAGVSGSVSHTGEGEWTVKTAKKLKVPVPIIKGAFDFRMASAKKPSYTGKVLSALRNQFGGHSSKK